MSLPRFLDIEYCQTDDALFPTAIAWSLADGQMKTVVIAPEDAWLPEDGDLGDVDLLYLEEQGYPCWNWPGSCTRICRTRPYTWMDWIRTKS